MACFEVEVKMMLKCVFYNDVQRMGLKFPVEITLASLLFPYPST